MKKIIISALMLLTSSVAWGQTACRTVDYPDHTEAICDGNEKAVPEKNSSSQALRITPDPAVKSPPIEAPPYATPSDTVKSQAVSTSMPASIEAVSSKHRETAAEHLARRKAHAIRNTAVLSNTINLAPAVEPGKK